MPTPANMQEAGLIQVALGHAVMTLLDKVADANGNLPGPWLDELEQTLIRDAKGSVAEGVDISIEARGMSLGVELVTALVHRLRRRLDDARN